MNIIVELSGIEGAGVESHWVDLTIRELDGKDSGQSVVRCICLHNDRAVREPMGKDGSGGECALQLFKSGAGFLGKKERDSLAGKAGERNGDVGIGKDKAAVKVGKTQERLNFLD